MRVQKRKVEGAGTSASDLRAPKSLVQSSRLTLYDEEEDDGAQEDTMAQFGLLANSTTMSSLGVRSLDIAPDVDEVYHPHDDRAVAPQHQSVPPSQQQHHAMHEFDPITGKKKYAKEAWPGRHPGVGPATVAAAAPIDVAASLSSNLMPSTSKRLVI